MNSTAAPILKVESLKKYFPLRAGFLQRGKTSIRAVDGVDMEISPNQTVGLVGESGSGKSTVARLILKLIRPDSGRIYFQNEEISALSEHRFKARRKQIQMIFQDPYSSLNPRMTIAQSIAEGVRISGIKKRQEQRRRIEALLDMVGMPKASADRYPHEFSGGQRQRVGIARALSVSPRLILCDEPISALDVSIQAQIINLLKDLQKELGLSYLFISHDLNVVSYICDHVNVMYKGQIMESAPATELFDSPRHPYTLKLLSASPSNKEELMPAEPMKKSTSQESHCAYAGQCQDQVESCYSSQTMHEVSPSHFVRCGKMAS